MDTLDLVERVLKKFGDGMDIAELVARMSLTGELTSKATNLKKTVSVLIYRDIKLKGEASRFCIPTRGKFALRQFAAEPVAAPKPQFEPNDIGYFYILVNDSFSNTWVKILTSYKPIAPDGASCEKHPRVRPNLVVAPSGAARRRLGSAFAFPNGSILPLSAPKSECDARPNSVAELPLLLGAARRRWR